MASQLLVPYSLIIALETRMCFARCTLY